MRTVLINTASNPNDSTWFVWAKILCEYQQDDAADQSNDLKYTDTIWKIKYKVLKAILNAS